MNDRLPPDEFEDINEAVGKEWESETTPYERIRRVIAQRTCLSQQMLLPKTREHHRKQHENT